MRIIVAGLTVVLLCGVTAAQENAPAAARDSATVSEAELAGWIAALGAREFESRDRAMQALIAAGRAAIDPALQVTTRGDHEVSTRAVMILKGIGEKGDIATLEAALAALGRIADTSNLPVGRRAAEVRERLEAVRQERAIEYFRSLGADVSPEFIDTWTSTFLAAPVFSLELGPKWKGTVNDLERLKWLRDVDQVSFVGPQVKDDWIRHLRGMPRLLSVKIKHANVSVKAVEELAQLERLRALRLMFVPLGDEMIPELEKCESLVRLVVISKALSEDGERRLKERFQEGVECPRGAMLGVRAGLEEPWSIREVVPGTAAERAGLRPNDRIVRYNGQPVVTFQELRTLISKSAPGDSAVVVVERGAETLELKVIFGEWD
jgi:hypothetical protein